MMKKLLVVTFAVILAVGLLAAAGCGDKKSVTETTGEDTEVVSLDEDVATGIVGTFNHNTGGPGSITFKKDGTFEGNAWGSEKKGTYKVEKNAEGFNVVPLKFDGGDAPETWSVGISVGKVFAVTNPGGDQYDKAQ